MSQSQKNQSAFNRLQNLSPVFTISDIRSLYGWDKNKASQYITRWKKSGYIESMGPRVPIYFNKIADKDAVSKYRHEAIMKAFPTAIVVGISTLHDAGWTTQIPRQMNIASIQRRTYPKVQDVDIQPRNKEWYIARKQFESEPIYGIPSVSPAFALADMWKYQTGGGLTIDDLEIPDDEHTMDEINAACEALGIENPLKPKPKRELRFKRF